MNTTIAKTELGQKAFAILQAEPPIKLEEGLTRLKALVAEAETEEQRNEIGWATEGFYVAASSTITG